MITMANGAHVLHSRLPSVPCQCYVRWSTQPGQHSSMRFTTSRGRTNNTYLPPGPANVCSRTRHGWARRTVSDSSLGYLSLSPPLLCHDTWLSSKSFGPFLHTHLSTTRAQTPPTFVSNYFFSDSLWKNHIENHVVQHVYTHVCEARSLADFICIYMGASWGCYKTANGTQDKLKDKGTRAATPTQRQQGNGILDTQFLMDSDCFTYPRWILEIFGWLSTLPRYLVGFYLGRVHSPYH